MLLSKVYSQFQFSFNNLLEMLNSVEIMRNYEKKGYHIRS